MKKIFLLTLTFLLAMVSTGLSVNANEIQEDKKYYTIEVVDNSSNQAVEIQVLSEQIDPVSYMRNADTDQQEVEYDVTFLLPLNNNDMARSSVGSEKEEASIHAKIKLTYNMSVDQNSIKISNVSGLWECTTDKYAMNFSDRTVAVTDGVPFSAGKNLTEHPISNTFSYDIDWGYVPYYPASTDGMSGARAYSEATGSIEGMGGSYTIYVLVAVP